MPLKVSLSIYLLKTAALSSVQKFFDEHGAVPLTNGLDGYFINLPASPKEPTWFRVVREHLSPPIAYEVRGQAPAGIVNASQRFGNCPAA